MDLSTENQNIYRFTLPEVLQDKNPNININGCQFKDGVFEELGEDGRKKGIILVRFYACEVEVIAPAAADASGSNPSLSKSVTKDD